MLELKWKKKKKNANSSVKERERNSYVTPKFVTLFQHFNNSITKKNFDNSKFELKCISIKFIFEGI